nr:hypothetical protein [Tanacetum cinerariifolium]
MDDLIDDAQKKVEAPPKKTFRKTGIWTDIIVDSHKNVVFSPETMVHYFDRDDKIFNDTGQAAEEVEHENAYSTNGLWSSYGYWHFFGPFPSLLQCHLLLRLLLF